MVEIINAYRKVIIERYINMYNVKCKCSYQVGDQLGNYIITEFLNRSHSQFKVKSTIRNKTRNVSLADIKKGRFNIWNDYSAMSRYVPLNKFEIHEDYVVGRTTTNNLVFYLDKDQYEFLIKSKKNVNDHALPGGRRFPTVNCDGKRVSLLKYLNTKYVGHFNNGNPFDLRHANLVSLPNMSDCNVMNRLRGVHFNNRAGSFVVTMGTTKTCKKLLTTKDCGLAIKTRLKKEVEIYGSLPKWKQELLDNCI